VINYFIVNNKYAYFGSLLEFRTFTFTKRGKIRSKVACVYICSYSKSEFFFFPTFMYRTSRSCLINSVIDSMSVLALQPPHPPPPPAPAGHITRYSVVVLTIAVIVALTKRGGVHLVSSVLVFVGRTQLNMCIPYNKPN